MGETIEAQNIADGRWTRIIPNWHPTKTNQLLAVHWAQQSRLKRVDAEMIWAYFRGVPAATGKRLVKMQIGLGHKQRGGDPDAYWKVVNDALVKNKLLVDDRKEWVELAPVEYYRTKSKLPETIITLSDMGAA